LGSKEHNLDVTDANGCTVNSRANLRQPERDDWQMTGNANTTPGNQFMGTTDNKDFVFKTNNIERMRITDNGNLKISSFAGTGNRLITADANGNLAPAPVFFSVCSTAPAVIAFQQSPADPADVFTCWRRIGIGNSYPQERLDVTGMARFSGWNTASSYINIGHDGVDAQGN
jgi:hypothetical protein